MRIDQKSHLPQKATDDNTSNWPDDARFVFGGQKRALGEWMLAWDEVFSWYLGVVYTGHTLRQQDGGWFLVVRCMKEDAAQVTFYGGATQARCFAALASDIQHNTVRWKKDRYT